MDQEMVFEMTMRRFFGEKAYQSAGQFGNKKNRKEWILKLYKLFLKEIDNIDTSDRHKKQLLDSVEAIGKELPKCDNPTWTDVFKLLSLIGKMLGFTSISGAKCYTIMYIQSQEQYFTEIIMTNGEDSRSKQDMNNVILMRRKIIDSLKNEGISDYKISLILNTTEYAIKKLKNDIAL